MSEVSLERLDMRVARIEDALVALLALVGRRDAPAVNVEPALNGVPVLEFAPPVETDTEPDKKAADVPTAGAFAAGPYVRLHLDELGEVWSVSEHPAQHWYAGAAGECFVCGWMTFDHPDAHRARKVVADHIRSLHAELAPVTSAALLRRIPGASDGDTACGTVAGYGRHHRAHETACAPCLAAQAVYDRERWRRRQAARVPNEDLARALGLADPQMRCFLLLGSLGLKCMDIAILERNDVMEAEMLLRVTRRYGGTERTFPLHPEVLQALHALPMPPSGPVFQRSRGGRYLPKNISKQINRYLHGLGIESTADQLRHWCRDLTPSPPASVVREPDSVQP